jgi:hypothetical protein
MDIKAIKAEFATLETLTLDAIENIRNLLARCSVNQLRELSAAKIKFVSRMAENRLS